MRLNLFLTNPSYSVARRGGFENTDGPEVVMCYVMFMGTYRSFGHGLFADDN